MASRTVVVKDLTKGILRNIERTHGARVQVGVQGKEASSVHPTASGSQTIGDVAFWNEYGTATAPERSFLRSTMDEQRVMIDQAALLAASMISMDRATPETALGIVGARLRQLVQAKIVLLKTPPNAPSTIAKKGFDDPLVHTMALHDAITSKVVLKGGRGRI